MAHLSALQNDSQRSLRSLYDAVRQKLVEHSDQKVLVIVDDLSSMEWIGITVEEIARFTRALCALSRQVCALLKATTRC